MGYHLSVHPFVPQHNLVRSQGIKQPLRTEVINYSPGWRSLCFLNLFYAVSAGCLHKTPTSFFPKVQCYCMYITPCTLKAGELSTKLWSSVPLGHGIRHLNPPLQKNLGVWKAFLWFYYAVSGTGSMLMCDLVFPPAWMWMFSSCPAEGRDSPVFHFLSQRNDLPWIAEQPGNCLPAMLLMSSSLSCTENPFDKEYTSSPLNIIAESSTLSSYLNSM